jgi:Flp pilus assembly protein TadD
MSGKKNKNRPSRHPPPKKADHSVLAKDATGIPKWVPIAVVAFTAMLYSRALSNGITLFDDDFYILKNPFLRDYSWHGVKAIFSSFYQSNYHPLTTLTYFFEYNFFGLNPMPYHLLNVLLHLLNTWLVFKLTEQLSGKKITAIIVSILFAIHPMHVESVAWISERKDVLYSAFYLLSLLMYLRYIDSGLLAKNYAITLLLFVASLLSKSAAVTLPVLLIVIDAYKGRRVNMKLLAEKIPFLLLSLVFGIINIYAQKAGGPVNVLFEYYGIINGIFLFTSGLALYLIRVVVPFGLSAMHYFPYIHGQGLPPLYYLSLPFVIIIVWLITRRQKNSLMQKEIIFGILFFLITISVMLQLVSVGSALTAERYTYIPYIGLFYITGQWLSNIIAKKKSVKIVITLFSLVMIIFAAQTWERISIWKDNETLLTDVIEKNPGILDVNYIYLLRADSRLTNHDLKGSLDDFTQAIAMNPQFAFANDAYYGRGHIYEELGDLKSAIYDYTNAITLSPKFAEAYNSRGWLYFMSGDTRAAMEDYNKAISLKPDYAEAYNNRGWAYNNMKNSEAAMQDYNKAILVAPSFEKPYFNRAAIKATEGNFEGAIDDYNNILKLDPDNNSAYYFRGLARLNLKNTTGACEDWKKAMELGNTNATQMLQQYCH